MQDHFKYQNQGTHAYIYGMTADESLAELNRLEVFFNSIVYPIAPITIMGFMTLNDLKEFVESNVNVERQA